MYFKIIARVMKILKKFCTSTQIDQWNIIEITKIEPFIYRQLIFNKVAKEIQCRKKSF